MVLCLKFNWGRCFSLSGLFCVIYFFETNSFEFHRNLAMNLW